MDISALVRSLDYRYVLLLEWFGSILMMATVWGWVYKKIYPKISKNLSLSRRHYLALDRFMRIKANEILPKLQEYEKENEDIGITPMTSFYTKLRLIAEELRIRNRLRNYGLLPEEKEKRILRRRETIVFVIRLLLYYYSKKTFAEVNLFVMRIVHAVTVNIFAGKLRIIIFFTGFLLWNISKVLAIYIRTISVNHISP